MKNYTISASFNVYNIVRTMIEFQNIRREHDVFHGSRQEALLHTTQINFNCGRQSGHTSAALEFATADDSIVFSGNRESVRTANAQLSGHLTPEYNKFNFLNGHLKTGSTHLSREAFMGLCDKFEAIKILVVDLSGMRLHTAEDLVFNELIGDLHRYKIDIDQVVFLGN